MTSIKQAIKEAVEKGIAAFPKGATIVRWCRGIKENVLHRYEHAMLVRHLTGVFSNSRVATSATATTITLDAMAVSLAIQKLVAASKHLNLDGLADDLGITREAVQRLIWLCADARDTSNGSKTYSAETITLVKNALFEERISKLTTTPFGIQPSLTKNGSQLTKQQWGVKDYGTSAMGALYVGSATAI